MPLLWSTCTYLQFLSYSFFSVISWYISLAKTDSSTSIMWVGYFSYWWVQMVSPRSFLAHFDKLLNIPECNAVPVLQFGNHLVIHYFAFGYETHKWIICKACFASQQGQELDKLFIYVNRVAKQNKWWFPYTGILISKLSEFRVTRIFTFLKIIYQHQTGRFWEECGYLSAFSNSLFLSFSNPDKITIYFHFLNKQATFYCLNSYGVTVQPTCCRYHFYTG